jgi:hypothetical protein
METNVDFTKVTWKEAATADLWYKIRFTLVTAGMTDTTPSCFHLVASPKKLTFFMIKQLMAFLEWACLKA